MIKGKLRDIQKADLEKLLDWRNQDFIRNAMFNDSLISYEQHIAWYKNLQNNSQKVSKIFCIEEREYGILNINNINRNTNSCEWGFYVGEKNTTRGTGLLLGYTSLKYIFSKLGMRKVCAEVLESNLISRNFHEKLGFKLDGVLRKHINRNGHYEDVYLYSIFHNEWQERSLKIKIELEEYFKCHK